MQKEPGESVGNQEAAVSLCVFIIDNGSGLCALVVEEARDAVA